MLLCGVLNSSKGGDQSENAVKALKDREGEYNTAFENLEATIKKAREHWLAIEVEEGEPAKPAFNKWQVTEYSPLDTAEEEHTRTFLAFREAALVVNGPRGEQYADAVKMMDEVRKAALKNLEIPGYVDLSVAPVVHTLKVMLSSSTGSGSSC